MWRSILSCICALIVLTQLYGDFETLGGDYVELDLSDQTPLFVSLGSYCAPASLARTLGLRKAAFPFDWNITLDGEKLIEMLREGFSNFLDGKYLVPFGPAALLNTYYHVEFVHEGSWEGVSYEFYMPILLTKYKRRIERFKKLGEYKGKVYFIRAAYINSIDDPHRFYKIKENIEISEDYAIRLYDTLRDVFPKLNFYLIIINNHDCESVNEEKRVFENLMMIRASHDYTKPQITENYRQFLEALKE